MYGRGRISLFADWPVLKYQQVPRNSRYSLYNSAQILILYQKSLLTSCTGNFRRLYHSAIVKRSQKRSKSWARLQIADEPLRFRLHQAPRPHEFSTLFMMMSVWSRTGPKSWKAIGSAYGLCQLVVTDVASQTMARADPGKSYGFVYTSLSTILEPGWSGYLAEKAIADQYLPLLRGSSR